VKTCKILRRNHKLLEKEVDAMACHAPLMKEEIGFIADSKKERQPC
jgi:hypothetical protein